MNVIMRVDINNPAKKQLITYDWLFFIFKVDEQKNMKVVGPFLANIHYDKRRKVVCY